MSQQNDDSVKVHMFRNMTYLKGLDFCYYRETAIYFNNIYHILLRLLKYFIIVIRIVAKIYALHTLTVVVCCKLCLNVKCNYPQYVIWH